MKKKIAILAFILPLILLSQEIETVKIGILADISGITKDQGGEFAEAFMDYMRYVNEKDPLYEKLLKPILEDYSYKAPLEILAYRRLLREKPVLVVGWGGEAGLISFVFSRDKVPFVLAQGSIRQVNTKTYPYTFLINMTPQDQVKLIAKWVSENYKDLKRLSIVHAGTEFGRSVSGLSVKNFLGKLGINATDFLEVPLGGNLEKTVKELKLSNSDWVIIHLPVPMAGTLLRDIYQENMKKKIFLTSWAFDRRLISISGEAAENVFGVVPFALWEEKDIPGIQLVRKISKLYHPGVEKRSYRYTHGIVVGMVVKKAMERAGRMLKGEYLKSALETFRDFKAMGLTGGITITRESHVGIRSARIYTIKGGKLVSLSNMLYINE